MGNYKELCTNITGQKDYHQCRLTKEPCVASNYPNWPQHFYTDVACRCPSKNKTKSENIESKIEKEQLSLRF